MGCLQLKYLKRTETHLEIVYRKKRISKAKREKEKKANKGKKVVQKFLSIDPMYYKLPSFSPYAFCLDNPILLVDQDGQLPWPIHVRSFISAKTVAGGLFQGDSRGPSLSTASDVKDKVTSRVRTSFIVDPAKGTITNPIPASDPSVFYGVDGILPFDVEQGKPTASITNKTATKGTLSFDFAHSGKDPITPGIVTPELDVHASLTVKEDLDNGTLDIKGSFTGDKFPSSEAFIVDQSGKGKIFLGAKEEQGGVGDLYGDDKEKLFKVDIQVQLDKKGNFTGVKSGGKTYSVKDYNKKVQSEFKSGSGSKSSSEGHSVPSY